MGVPASHLAFVLVLILVLVVVLILIVVLIVVLILVLILIHVRFLQKIVCGDGRYPSIPNFSCFILGLEEQTYQESCKNGCSDTAGSGSKATDEDTEKAHFVHGFPYALGQKIAKARQGNACTSSGKLHQGLIYAERTQKYTNEHIADQYPGRCQLGFVDEDLPNKAEKTANDKCL